MSYRQFSISGPQKGIYVECMNDPESTMYNLPFLYRLPDTLDVERFIRCFEQAMSLNTGMSTRLFLAEDGSIMQRTQEGYQVRVEKKEVSDEAFCEIRKHLLVPFDLLREPLWRAVLYTTETSHWFFLDIHHIIFDGTSMLVLGRQIRTLYEGGRLEGMSGDGIDVAQIEAEIQKEPVYQEAEDYFIHLLDGMECDCAPFPDVEGCSPSEQHLVVNCSISEAQVREFCDTYSVSKTVYFTAVMGFVTAKYNFRNDSVIATVFNGRNRPEFQDCITMLVKTLPFVTDMEKCTTVRELMENSREQIKKSREYSFYPFADIAAKTGMNSDILFAYQGKLLDFKLMQGADINGERIYDDSNVDQSKLIVEVLEKDCGTYELSLKFRGDTYSEAFVQTFARSYIKAAKQFLKAEKLNEISILSEEDEESIRVFNQTAVDVDLNQTVVELFREQVKAHPDHIAVVSEDKRYTYSEVDAISERLAKYLVTKGFKAEDVIAILIPRNEYIAIAPLGVLKAGCAYQPLDPTYPKDRLQFMLEDSLAKLLICDRSLLELVEDYSGEILFLDEILELEEIDVVLPKARPEDLFILLYTSGSTGVPKGCMLEYGNITAFCHWFRNYYHIDTDSKYAAYASFGFDASMMDTYGTLTAGGELHVIPESIRLDFMAIGHYFEKNGITHSFMTTQIGRQFALSMEPKGLKYLSTGGEKLVPCEPPKGYKFYNLYGPTECTILTTAYQVTKYENNIPIGRPLDNLKLYVCDTMGHMLPPGACGELMISGYQVSRGYLNRPEKTAEVYSLNPYDDEKGYERIYHSGDVVRYLSDGNIQIIGRQDGQVKIRGFRIELTEVEEVIRRFAGVKDATVAAFDDPAGGKYIAAYVVSDEKVDILALNEFILSEKPPYMVPAVTMQIDAIPMNQNQKVNKRALPIPERRFEEIVPPQNKVQQKIFDIIVDVIGHKDFGVTTSIYMAGLTSITAVQLNILLSKAFDRPIKTSDLKNNDTVEKLEKLLSQAIEEEPFEVLTRYPLTKTQEGIFVECVAHPGSTIYNIPILLKISDNLDQEALRKAVVQTVDAHPYIMTTLEMDAAGNICFVRDDSRRFKATEIAEKTYVSKNSMMEQLIHPFELLDSRLFRIGIFQTELDGTYLYLEFHHIISDGTSMQIFLEDISKAYMGESVEKERYSGFEASLMEQRQRNSDAYAKAKAYYDKLFDGCDAECLPKGDRKGNVPSNEVMNRYHSVINVSDVKSFCEKNKVTANGFFTAAFGLTLSKYINKEQAIFATIYHGRSDSRLERSISMYVKTFPVMCSIGTEDGSMKTAEYVRKIGEQLENSMANDVYSFAEISRNYQINADVMFAYQGEDFTFDTLCGEPCTMISVELDQVKAPLNVNVFIEGDKIRFFCEYRGDLFSETYIESFLTAFEMAAASLMEQDVLSKVSILSKEEQSVLEKLNDTKGTSYKGEYISLPKRLEQVIKEQGEKIAVTAAGKSLSYKELGWKINSIANGLVNLGVKADQPVALMLYRTIDVYPVRQGILKSGGAFLSLEPDYPDDRIKYILENAGVHILITTKEVYEERKDLLKQVDVLVIDLEDLYQNDGSEGPNVEIAPEQLAYCIYTSGSTGTPKGVMIEQRNLLNFLDHHDKNRITHYYLDDTKVMLALAAITFDVSVLEEFIPLYYGKQVAMATEEEIHNPILLAKMMQETGVDVMKCTPSYIQTILDVPMVREAFSKLKAICIGAEPFPEGLYDKMRKAGIHGRIYNSYGPSETTVTVTIDDMTDERISIGKPIGNTKIWILDNFGNILPRFVPGEITIAGWNVGRGYMGLSEMTKEKFIEVRGERAYRSGDIGLWNGDGKIVCKGRKDNQVKLRGLRIELDEIEKVMTLYDGVDRSVVLVKENESGQYLCGYYTGRKEIAPEELSRFMKTKLTEYMVPGVFVYLESLPMNKNGKVDKRALPEPVVKVESRNGREPISELEKIFCEMFAQVLGVQKVFADDDFFSLGGTSLSASKIVMNCMMQNLPVSYADVFAYTTPKMMADFVVGSFDGGEVTGADEKEPASNNEKSTTDNMTKTDNMKEDYPIREVLAHNTSKFAAEVTFEPLRKVLLSGSTGFLGIHVLKELMEQNCETIYCLVRKGDMDSSERRLKTILMYYFDQIFDEEFKSGRIKVIEADITDEDLEEKLCDCEFDTVINCAAIVKHFVVGDLIERVNVGGVKNLIQICKIHDARMIQVSTVSVAGESVDNSVPYDKVITEQDLYFGQNLDNRYVNTKFRAEEAVLCAIEQGLRGKIIRVGNLMSREEDGEFQINYVTNGFMSRLRAYAALEKFPVGGSDAEVEFSPIDSVARAVVLLAGTNDCFTLFHAYNCHHVHMANVIQTMNALGIKIDVVDDEEYALHFKELLKDEQMNMKISSLISYDSSDGGEHRFIGSENKFTIKVLYRLGFAWPLISENYLQRAIEALSTLDFFDE